MRQACEPIRVVETLAVRLKSAREEAGLTQPELAKLAGVSAGTVGNLEAGIRKQPRELLALARVLKVSAEWLKTGKGLKRIPTIDDAPPLLGEPHPPGYGFGYNAVKTVNWADLSGMSFTGVFRTAAPDDAMAPRVKAGQMLVFNSALDPRPGDGVLVRDVTGTVYFRRYQEGRPSHWSAVALDSAYRALDSEKDQLQLLAVLVAVEARWS